MTGGPGTGAAGAAFSPEEVRRVAALAKLRLSDEEVARFAAQFPAILAHLRSLAATDTTGVAPLDHPLPLTDALRDDEPRPGLSRYDALSRAPAATRDQVVVPSFRPDDAG